MDPKSGTEIVFNENKLKKIKKLYQESPGDTFMFEGKEIYKPYAKYMIEFLENKLGKPKKASKMPRKH